MYGLILFALTMLAAPAVVPADPSVFGTPVSTALQFSPQEIIDVLVGQPTVPLEALSALASLEDEVRDCRGCSFAGGSLEVDSALDPDDPNFQVTKLTQGWPGPYAFGVDGSCHVKDSLCQQATQCAMRFEYAVTIPADWMFGYRVLIQRFLPDGTLYWAQYDDGYITFANTNRTGTYGALVYGECGCVLRYVFGAVSPDLQVFAPMFNADVTCDWCYWHTIQR